MYYLMITVSALLFAVQFLFNNEYRKESGDTWNSSLKFILYTSLFGIIALLLINRFHMDFSLFSVCMAIIYSIIAIALGYSSIKALIYANLSIYSIFAMIGGMLLPSVYGIICGEELKLTRLICIILIAVSILMSANKGEGSRQALKYYIAVFVLNGMIGVISKYHQMNVDLCVDSGSFMIMTKIITAALSAVLLMLQKERSYSISTKACVYTVLHSLANSIGNLLVLIALIHVPASVQYPIITGGTIVFSILLSVLTKEQITKKEYIGAGIAFISTVFMAL